jgi:putative restriction endonuclease
MAKGKRWALHEFVLCLDLYLRRGTLHGRDAKVEELASLIGRTPASVALRLGNFQYVDPDRTGVGLAGGETDCVVVWRLLAGDPARVAGLARLARRLLG